jgi:hypothetical protein
VAVGVRVPVGRAVPGGGVAVAVGPAGLCVAVLVGRGVPAVGVTPRVAVRVGVAADDAPAQAPAEHTFGGTQQSASSTQEYPAKSVPSTQK